MLDAEDDERYNEADERLAQNGLKSSTRLSCDAVPPALTSKSNANIGSSAGGVIVAT